MVQPTAVVALLLLVSLPPAKLLWCQLPPANGNGGDVTPLEDCSNLGNFEILPMPASDYDIGVHPWVCCPKIAEGVICTPADEWCINSNPGIALLEEVVEQEYEEEEYYEDQGDGDYEDNAEEDELADTRTDEAGGGTEEDTYEYDYVDVDYLVSDEECEVGGCINFRDCPVLTEGGNANIEKITTCGWDEEDKSIKVSCLL